MRFLALLAAVLLCSTSFAQTILLVRHAEKVSEAPDALLSAIGKQRAAKLARTLADAGVTAIFTTEAKRTQQTAAPLAKALHLQPTVIPGKDIVGLVSKLAAQPTTAVVLVIGHSNTLPEVINRLRGGSDDKSIPPITINDVDYDKLFVITPNPPKDRVAGGEGRRNLLILHY